MSHNLETAEHPAPEDDELDVLGLSEVQVSAMKVHPGWENPSVGQLNKFKEKLTAMHSSIPLFPSALSPHRSHYQFLSQSSATMAPNLPADTCLTILGLDSYSTGLLTVNNREENQKFLTNSESIHMCLLLIERICKGTFDICRDAIPAIYFPLAHVFQCLLSHCLASNRLHRKQSCHWGGAGQIRAPLQWHQWICKEDLRGYRSHQQCQVPEHHHVPFQGTWLGNHVHPWCEDLHPPALSGW